MALEQGVYGRQTTGAGPDEAAHNSSLRWVAYLLTLVVLAVAGYQFTEQWQRIFDLRPVERHLWARVPEAGGWQFDTVRIPAGRDVHLTVHGVSGVHTFALGYTDVASGRPIKPGDEMAITFTAPAPGRYVLYCTTWCSAHHWRMRTVIEVYDPADPEAILTYAQSAPRYPLAVEPAALDRPHPAEAWPAATPDAALGASLWEQSAPEMSPQQALAAIGWPNVSPEDTQAWLRETALGESTVADTGLDAAGWAMAAYLWQEASTPAEVAQGQTLYQQNCAACHGDAGQGDGFAAATSVDPEPDFTDLRAGAGASPALYYAKIARGGMGTGMPNWGTVLAEDELWALVAYIQTFAYTPASPLERAAR